MTIIDLRQGVRDFFGRLLCLCGSHDWGRWRTAPLTLPGLRWRFCERMPRTCKAKQFDSLPSVDRPADREGVGR